MRIAAIVCSGLVLCALTGVVVEGSREKLSAGSATTGVQDAVYLDRRISMLEMRLNSIESTLRALEQQAMLQRQAPAQTTRDLEGQLLRTEVELLKSRVRELECGIVHLDERTLSPGAKEARKKTGSQFIEPCRLNPEAPVQLSAPR